MPISLQHAVSALISQLTPQELEGCVAYAAGKAIPGGTSLNFPHRTIRVSRDAYLIFVDRDPMANWSHSCRYVLIDCDFGQLRSIEADLPPFSASKELDWRVVYRGASVSEAMFPAREEEL